MRAAKSFMVSRYVLFCSWKTASMPRYVDGYIDFSDPATNFLGLSHESDKDFKAQRP